MKYQVYIFLLMGLCFVGCGVGSMPPKTYTVLEVISGDTLLIDYNGTKERVGLLRVRIGAGAKESRAAKERLEYFLEGCHCGKCPVVVALEFEEDETLVRDSGGRIMAYPFGYGLNTHFPQGKHVTAYLRVHNLCKAMIESGCAKYDQSMGKSLKYHAVLMNAQAVFDNQPSK